MKMMSLKEKNKIATQEERLDDEIKKELIKEFGSLKDLWDHKGWCGTMSCYYRAKRKVEERSKLK